jgi:hypothetical protein
LPAANREKQSEKRRSHDDAGNHLSNHLGLSEPASDHSHEPANRQDDEHLKKESRGQLG